MSIAGLQIGVAAFEAAFDNTAYQASVSVRLSGVAKLVASGRGSGSAQGRLVGMMPSPSNYALQLTTGDRHESVRMGITGNSVRSLAIQPEKPPQPGQVPLLANHKQGVLDPLSAGMFHSSQPSHQMASDACSKTYPVFDGRQRYDLTFTYHRREQIAVDGYNGEVLVCRVAYRPVAGHVAGKPDVEFLSSINDMEVWIAPVADSRSFVPARISIRTQMGLGLVEATKLNLGSDPTTTSSVRR